MSPAVFIDTSYILALVNTADEYHDQAALASLHVQPPFLTTEAILIELGNALARVRWRVLGVATINDLRHDPNIEVIAVDTILFERALALYGQRPDKEWGLTDCISFVVMRQREITEALTGDRHFEQAGFVALLK